MLTLVDAIAHLSACCLGASSSPSLIPLAEDDDAADSSEDASLAASSSAASSLRGLFNPAFDAPNLSSTNIGKTTQTSMGAMKERINAAALAGRAIARGGASSASAPTTPQRAVTDENAIGEDRDLFASRTAPSTPSFVPVPLVAKQPAAVPFLGQRLTRDVVPAAGKLNELRSVGQRTSLFPSTTGAAANIARGSAAGASDAAAMLHHGIDQVLATKDSARRYIEGQWPRDSSATLQFIAVLTDLFCVVLCSNAQEDGRVHRAQS